LLHDLDHDETRENLTRHGVVKAEELRSRMPEDCLYSIKSHDHRSGLKPRSHVDKALTIADSLAIIFERVSLHLASFEDIESEVEAIAEKKPWLKTNLDLCEEMGARKTRLLELLHSLTHGSNALS